MVYAGAGSRLPPDRGLSLDPDRWGWSPKVDGVYCRARTDRAGRLASLVARSGAAIGGLAAGDLVGLETGLPDAELHGELEAGTEAGIRARQTRGWAVLHLFDVSRFVGADVAGRPYAERVGLLHRWQAGAECYGEVPRLDWWTKDVRGDAHDPRGRYTRPVPRDLRRLPIVPIARGRSGARQLWREHVEVGGGEGLVAVRLDASLGGAGAKRKVKATMDLDVVVLSVEPGVAEVAWRGHKFLVSARGKKRPRRGEVWSVLCDGFYERDVIPRFARLSRRRDDLMVSVACVNTL